MNLRQIVSSQTLSIMDAEVLAVSSLAHDMSQQKTDDRRHSIEIQSAEAVTFADNPPSAVILPTVYLDEEPVATALDAWGSEILNYDTYGLSMASYFGQIFMKFTDYCKGKNIL